jgi:NitT/TauT family transport system substrate-binding protein
LEITYDPLKISLFRSANNAYDVGLLAKGKPRPELTEIFDLTQLNEVLSEKGLNPVEVGGIATTSNGSTIDESFGAVQ